MKPTSNSQLVTLIVNNQTVSIEDHKTSGLGIKEAAIAQGVSIQLSFALFRVTGHTQHPIRDDEEITIHENQEFRAVAADDNSRTVTSSVQQAIEEIRSTFDAHAVSIDEDSQGGAVVTVADVHIGDQYVPSRSAIAFIVSYQYPAADVYPHFLLDNPRRVEDGELGAGMSATKWNGREVVQVSRRSKRWKQGADTAAIKLTKVLEWIRSR